MTTTNDFTPEEKSLLIAAYPTDGKFKVYRVVSGCHIEIGAESFGSPDPKNAKLWKNAMNGLKKRGLLRKGYGDSEHDLYHLSIEGFEIAERLQPDRA